MTSMLMEEEDLNIYYIFFAAAIAIVAAYLMFLGCRSCWRFFQRKAEEFDKKYDKRGREKSRKHNRRGITSGKIIFVRQ